MQSEGSSSTSTFSPPTGEIAKKAGYIVWLDKQPVTFYTNDLYCDVPGDIVRGDDEEAIKCVHGVVKINRWMGNESMKRTEIMAPAVVVAYNFFMNGVDRMDQARAVNPTRRREKRVGMSLFTWAIDIACHNGYCIMKKMMPKANVSLREYKRQLSVLLTEPHRLE